MATNKSCDAWQANRRVPDFACSQGAGHGDAHKDPRTGTRWGYPEHPYGMRAPRKPPTGHAKTKPGVYYSDKPAGK